MRSPNRLPSPRSHFEQSLRVPTVFVSRYQLSCGQRTPNNSRHNNHQRTSQTNKRRSRKDCDSLYLRRMNHQAALCYFLLFLCPSSHQTKPTRRFRDGDKQVLIFDKLFPTEVVRSYYELVTTGSVTGNISSWFYTYSDYYQDIGTLNTSSNSPWIAPINPGFFSNTALWKISRKVIEKLTDGKQYFPYDVSFSMHRRLDFITATSKGKGKSSVTVKLFVFLF